MSMKRTTALGIPCPGDESDPITWRYRAWYALYRRSRQVMHWFGIHERQRHYSIAPRCDWCGHRSAKQKRIAAQNRREATLHTEEDQA